MEVGGLMLGRPAETFGKEGERGKEGITGYNLVAFFCCGASFWNVSKYTWQIDLLFDVVVSK